MAIKTAKTSKKEANMTPNKVNMVALKELLEEHRTALAAEFKAAISTLEVKLDCVQATVSDHGQRLTMLESIEGPWQTTLFSKLLFEVFGDQVLCIPT